MVLLPDMIRLLYVAAPGGKCDGRLCDRSIFRKKHQGQSEHFMNRTDSKSETVHGLAAVLLANRAKLISFLIARGAGDGAEDVFQELWVQIAGTNTGPVANPLAYLFRAANNLMLDRYRSARAGALREKA